MKKNYSKKDYTNWCFKHCGSIWLANYKADKTEGCILFLLRINADQFVLVNSHGNRWIEPSEGEHIYSLLNNHSKNEIESDYTYTFIQSGVNFDKLITNKTYKILFTEGK